MSFRDLALLIESGADDSYEPLLLWMIPVYLRTRQEYYLDAVKNARRRIDALWEQTKNSYESRDEFERTRIVEYIWNRSGPPWWGLNDIVGWIDVRLFSKIEDTRIELSLFLPTKRISRRLVDKRFVFRRREVVPVTPNMTNQSIHEEVIVALNTITSDKRIRKYFVEIENWRLKIYHTDVQGLIRDYNKIITS